MSRTRPTPTLAAMLRHLPSAAELTAAAGAILDAGFTGVALERPFYEVDWARLAGMLPKGAVHAVRLFLPYPRPLHPGQPWPVSIGATGREDQRDAAKFGKATVEFADRHAIPFVLVPVVGLEKPTFEDLSRLREGTRDSEAILTGLQAVRAAHVGPHLDSYWRTLSQLLEVADRYSTALAIVPGGALNELPNTAETLATLAEFRGAPVKVWPDTAKESTDLATCSEDRWSELEGHSAGVTLADLDDANELCPPGTGVLTWEPWRSRLLEIPRWLAYLPERPAPEVIGSAAATLLKWLEPPGEGLESGV